MPVPHRDDDKGWEALEKSVARYQKAYHGADAHPLYFDFHLHVQSKRAQTKPPKPEKREKRNKPCAKRRCTFDRPCPPCRVRMRIDAVEAMLSDE